MVLAKTWLRPVPNCFKANVWRLGLSLNSTETGPCQEWPENDTQTTKLNVFTGVESSDSFQPTISYMKGERDKDRKREKQILDHILCTK